MKMTKLITFTLKDCGDMNLIDTGLENAMCEIQAMAEGMSDDEFPRTVKITIDKKYTQKDIENLPDYEG